MCTNKKNSQPNGNTAANKNYPHETEATQNTADHIHPPQTHTKKIGATKPDAPHTKTLRPRHNQKPFWVITALTLLTATLATANLQLGPSISETESNPALLVTRAGARITLVSRQPIARKTLKTIKITPGTQFDSAVNGNRVTLAFKKPLKYATSYHISGTLYSQTTGASRAFTTTLRTEDPILYSLVQETPNNPSPQTAATADTANTAGAVDAAARFTPETAGLPGRDRILQHRLLNPVASREVASVTHPERITAYAPLREKIALALQTEEGMQLALQPLNATGTTDVTGSAGAASATSTTASANEAVTGNPPASNTATGAATANTNKKPTENSLDVAPNTVADVAPGTVAEWTRLPQLFSEITKLRADSGSALIGFVSTSLAGDYGANVYRDTLLLVDAGTKQPALLPATNPDGVSGQVAQWRIVPATTTVIVRQKDGRTYAFAAFTRQPAVWLGTFDELGSFTSGSARLQVVRDGTPMLLDMSAGADVAQLTSTENLSAAEHPLPANECISPNGEYSVRSIQRPGAATRSEFTQLTRETAARGRPVRTVLGVSDEWCK